VWATYTQHLQDDGAAISVDGVDRHGYSTMAVTFGWPRSYHVTRDAAGVWRLASSCRNRLNGQG
jgi:hypothetical protein